MWHSPGTAADGTVQIDRQDLVHDRFGPSAKRLELLTYKCVSDHHEPVTMEDLDRTFNLVWLENFEVGDAVVLSQLFSKRTHAGVIGTAHPGRTRRIAGNEVAMFG